MSKYACRDCDTTFTAPTDTDTVRCPGCGDMVEQQPAVSSSPPDQTNRDRIAAALREHYLSTNRNETDADGNLPCRCGDWREPGAAVDDENDWDAHLADAVMPALPPAADRAAVLLEVFDALRTGAVAYDPAALEAAVRDGGCRAVAVYVQTAIGEHVRRLAAEAPQPDTETQAEEVRLLRLTLDAVEEGRRELRAENSRLRSQLWTLAAVFEGFGRLLATSSRDWGQYAPDAWLYAVICGWDCEQPVHDETCTHGAMEEMAERHGWDAATVAKARRYRAVVHTLTAPAVPVQPAADVVQHAPGRAVLCPDCRTKGHAVCMPDTAAPAAAGPGRAADTRDDEETHNSGPGWYEVINPRNATTNIAYVQEDGSLYLPEGDALTPDEFAFAAARGNAHRLVRADEGTDRG